MTTPDISRSLQQHFAGDSPALLALQFEASPELMLAVAPAARPEWTPAAQSLTQLVERQGPSTPIIPLYLGKAKRAGVRAGKPIDSALLMAMPSEEERLGYLRWRTSLLAGRHVFKPRTSLPLRNRKRQGAEAIAPPVARELIAREVTSLGPECLLAEQGVFAVLLARSGQIPNTLAEIGRLRELTFRAAGEGTGRAFDLDRFDYAYQHLFVWNREAEEIAGAYRLSLTDGGPLSLYSATLFHFGEEFLNRLGPAIELGRSFVRVEYQRSFTPLLLLWKGIGAFVASRPRYKSLFGPVSISNQYQSISRELMIAFLEKRELLADLANLVRPRHAPPPRRAELPAGYCRDLNELSDLVADLEPGKAGVPVLLRHYLRLGGKLLGFNLDRDFANVLDGLIVVNLARTEPRLLERYLGKKEAAAFLAGQE